MSECEEEKGGLEAGSGQGYYKDSAHFQSLLMSSKKSKRSSSQNNFGRRKRKGRKKQKKEREKEGGGEERRAYVPFDNLTFGYTLSYICEVQRFASLLYDAACVELAPLVRMSMAGGPSVGCVA